MQVQLTSSDYLAAIRLGYKPRPFFAALGVLLALFFLFGLGLVAKSALMGQSSWTDLGIALCVGYFPGWYYLYLPWRVGKVFKQQRSLREPFSIEFEDAGLRFRTPQSDGLLPWDHLHKWRESKVAFVLYHSDALFNILPKRFFGSPVDESAFREILKRSVGPANQVSKPEQA